MTKARKAGYLITDKSCIPLKLHETFSCWYAVLGGRMTIPLMRDTPIIMMMIFTESTVAKIAVGQKRG